jgi:hypothetical protein
MARIRVDFAVIGDDGLCGRYVTVCGGDAEQVFGEAYEKAADIVDRFALIAENRRWARFIEYCHTGR